MEGDTESGALLPEIGDAAEPLPEAEIRRRARNRARFELFAKIAIVLLLLVQLALEVSSARGMTATYDEAGHLRYGMRLLHGNASRFDDSKMPVTALNALVLYLGERLPPRYGIPLGTLLAARVPTMLASLLISVIVARWAWLLWGARGALLSTLLVVFDPNLLAHARVVTTDVYAALAFTAAFFLAWRCAQRPTTGRAAALLLVVALAQAVKYSAVLLPPLLAVVALVRYRGARRRPGERLWPVVRRAVRRTVVWACATTLFVLVVVNLAFLFDRTLTRFGDYQFRSATLRAAQQRWPALDRVPVPLPYPWLEGLDWVRERERTGFGYGRIYLRGEVREGRGFPGYYLWCWLYKVPLPTQLLLAGALVLAWRWRRSLRWGRDLVFLLVPALLLAIHLNFFFRAQMGIRYSLMMFPPLYVFCGLLGAGWARLPRRPRLAVAGMLAASAWLVASVLSWHPYYLSYFNELVRDRRQAWRLLADSNLDWGQSKGYLEHWKQGHPEAIVSPARPTAGLVVVSANDLVGIFRDAHYEWLRPLQPVDTVGYSYIVFDVKPDELPPAAQATPKSPPAKEKRVQRERERERPKRPERRPGR